MQRSPNRRVVILGGGMSGIAMGIALRRAGYRDFVILEKAAEIGGTWWDNTYPGAQCDVPSHLYSLGKAPAADWSRYFAPQPEILSYMRNCAERNGLGAHIRAGCAITAARFDAGTSIWNVATSDGDAIEADAFVYSAGTLSTPRYPDVSGVGAFAGPAFHTSRWDHGVDLAGKRVAVIGSAASAVQVVPQIAAATPHVDLYQRSPNWILPRGDFAYPAWRRRLYSFGPARQIHRTRIAISHELTRRAFEEGTRAHRKMTQQALEHLARQVPDPALRARLTPDYPIGCKRILITDDFYPALARGDVNLVTDPVTSITTDGITTADGRLREHDVVVYATGFDLRSAPHAAISGRDGLSLADAWRDGLSAYHGILVPGFPNLFCLLGPNTGNGHTSALIHIEAGVAYTMRCLRELDRRGARTLDADAAATAAHNTELQRRLAGTVWNGPCGSWYKTADGRIDAAHPGYAFQFPLELRRLGWGDYRFG